MRIFKLIYYWFVNKKDDLIYGKSPEVLPFRNALIKYGWSCPPRRLDYNGYTFSYEVEDKKVDYVLDIRGWRGDMLMYLGVQEKITLNDGTVLVNKYLYDEFGGYSGNIISKNGFIVRNEKDAIDALISIDPYFKSHIRELRLSSILDK